MEKGHYNRGKAKLKPLGFPIPTTIVNQKKMERAERFVKGRVAWMAFFMFIPFLGEAIGVVLGLMHANVWITAFSMLLGKSFRYIAVAATALGLTTLFT